MRKSTALILCCALIFVSAADDVSKKTTTSSTTSTVTPTTIKPTIPTTKPSTSTVPPTTTTEPTTTTTTTTTTTEVPTTLPTTTTSAPVTPTPVPGPPKKGMWNVTGTDGLIIAQMAIQLNVMYNGTNKQNMSRAVIDVPNDAVANGTFDKYNETLKLSWKSASGLENNYVAISFKRDDKTYILSGVEVSILPENLPGLNSTLKLVHTKNHFNTTLGNSYRCVRLLTFNLTAENDPKIQSQMEVSDLQFQAFKADKKANFGLAEDCAFDTPDIVPIAVGCVLAGLVVIVLAAYLFSRRRSQTRGYLSM